MEESYDTTSYGYLKRALIRLAEEKHEALFYAAFELRCGVEAKLKEHLDALDELSKRKKKGWKIAHAGYQIEKAFKTGDKVIEYLVTGEAKRFSFSLFYIPVRRSTRDAVQKRLHKLMHAMDVFPPKGAAWWNDTRAALVKIAEDLADANRGTLMGLMFEPERATPKGLVLEPGEQKTTGLFLAKGSKIHELVQRHLTQGKALRIEPRVWNGIPEHAHQFLNPMM